MPWKFDPEIGTYFTPPSLGAPGSGDVVGPAGATDSNFAAFDTTTGKLLKDSGLGSSSFVASDDARLSDARQLAAGDDKTKLDGIAAGANVNVNADWNAGSGDAQILNKPTIPGQALETSSSPTFADITITGLSGSIITADEVETAIEELDDSIASQKQTGFGAWTSGTDANTYTITGGKFQLDRSGYGYINGKKVSWAASQQTGVLSANTFYSVYIDASGLIQTSTSPFTANVIRLFEVLYDGTIYQVSKENHLKEFTSSISGFLHKSIGTIIQGTGANITRVATGTGASADDRRIKIVGADVLSDHGLDTTITAQDPITWNVYYRNGSGKWIRDSQVTELPIKYNNVGTPTALDITNAYAEYVLYVIKDDIESSAPQYIAVMGEAVYTVLATLLTAITDGNAIYSTNELANLEAAQLGYAIVQYSAAGGYIEELQIAKSTLNQQIVSGGGSTGDHGLLTGLADDDHTQYHNDARGDARYEASGAISTHAALTTGVHGAGANSLVYSNDAKLTDARTPLTHDSTKHSVTYALPADVTYIGTTSVALNRGSGALVLTGITSIDGSAATLTTARNIGGRSFNGSADIIGPTWKTGITTRDITTASGVVNVAHGLGRVPSFVRVKASLISSASVTQECHGSYDGTNHAGLSSIYSEGTSTAVSDTIYSSTSFELGFSAATVVNPYTGANRQTATITVDATNIIFTWTKTGTVASAVANILWECC